MHDAPMRTGTKALGDRAKLYRRDGELPVLHRHARADHTRVQPAGWLRWCAGLLAVLSAAPPILAAAPSSATSTFHAPSRALRLELIRGGALLRRQMARLPEGSAVVLLHEPDRLVLRLPASLLFAPDALALRSGHDVATVVSVIVQPLQRRPRLSAQVLVYTDSIGGPSYNESASTARAQAVAAALVAQGVSSARFEAHGAGASEPLAGNDTPAGRIRNRRVEIVFEYAPALKRAPATGHAGG